MEYVNRFTGEVKKMAFGSPLWKPAEPDYEHYEEGTSMTAPDQVEPLQQIVARCMRGELLRGSEVKQAVYDDGLSDSEVALMDGTADLADIPSLVSAATAADGAKGGVEAQSAVDGSRVASSEQATAESKTQSNDSSESKG